MSDFTKPSKDILEYIKEEEAFKSKVYDDRTGKSISKEDLKNKNYKGFPTIGYGRKLSKEEIKSGKVKDKDIFKGISKEEATKIFNEQPQFNQIKSKIDSKQGKARLTKEQIDAMYSLGYNAGPNAVSTKIDLLEKDKDKTMDNWSNTYTTSGGKKMGGLVKRRKHEQELIKQGEQRKIDAKGSYHFGSIKVDNINVDEISLEDIENELKRK